MFGFDLIDFSKENQAEEGKQQAAGGLPVSGTTGARRNLVWASEGCDT